MLLYRHQLSPIRVFAVRKKDRVLICQLSAHSFCRSCHVMTNIIIGFQIDNWLHHEDKLSCLRPTCIFWLIIRPNKKISMFMATDQKT